MKSRSTFFLKIPQSLFQKYKTFSFKKKLLTIGILVILLLVLLSSIGNISKPAAYTTSKVTKSNITEIVSESGNIIASGKTDVYSPTSGVVTEVYVTNGDNITKGDELFKVESSATEQESQQAYSNYLAAVATLNAAQSTANTLRAGMYAEWKSFRDLATNSTYEKGDDTPDVENRKAAEFQIAQDEWLASEKKYKDQQTAIAQAQAQVLSTEKLYQATQDAIVNAPIDGTVSNLAIVQGGSTSIKTVSLSGGSSTPALVLSKGGVSQILLSLSETDIVKVKQGQHATVSINAISDKAYKAKVSRVDSIGTDINGVVTYNVYLTLLGSDSSIRQGMTVDADIVTSDLKGVLSVPNSAVKPYQGGKAVRIPDKSKKEKFRYQPVKIGVRGTTRTQILEGLTDGQEIITTLSNETIKRAGFFGN